MTAESTNGVLRLIAKGGLERRQLADLGKTLRGFSDENGEGSPDAIMSEAGELEVVYGNGLVDTVIVRP